MDARIVLGFLLIPALLSAVPVPEYDCPTATCLKQVQRQGFDRGTCRNASLAAEDCINKLSNQDNCHCSYEDTTRYYSYKNNPGLLAEIHCRLGDQCRFSHLKRCYSQLQPAVANSDRDAIDAGITCLEQWNGDTVACLQTEAKFLLQRSDIDSSINWKRLVIQALQAVKQGCGSSLIEEVRHNCWSYFGGFALSADYWFLEDEVEFGFECIKDIINNHPVCAPARPLVEAAYTVFAEAARKKCVVEDEYEYYLEDCEDIWLDY